MVAAHANPFNDPVIVPPDDEYMHQYYLSGNVFGKAHGVTPVATRLPVPDAGKDTVDGFIRVESAGGVRVSPLSVLTPLFHVSTLLHAYSPDEDEAADISRTVCGLVGAARGFSVPDGSGWWYIESVVGVSLPQRLTDPMVNLIRYRAMVTWAVVGRVGASD